MQTRRRPELVNWTETRRVISLADALTPSAILIRRRGCGHGPVVSPVPAQSHLGRLWRLPGADAAILTSLTRGLFPLSRAWAAAQVVDRDMWRALPIGGLGCPRTKLRRVPGLEGRACGHQIGWGGRRIDSRCAVAQAAMAPGSRRSGRAGWLRRTGRLDAADSLARARLQILAAPGRGARPPWRSTFPTAAAEVAQRLHGHRLTDVKALPLRLPQPIPVSRGRRRGCKDTSTTEHWLHLPDRTGRAGGDCCVPMCSTRRARPTSPPLSLSMAWPMSRSTCACTAAREWNRYWPPASR